MSVPSNIGVLSTYQLQQAISTVDHELKDAPEHVREAVATIRLVAGVPRATPWYGVGVDPDDSSITVSTVLTNAMLMLERHESSYAKRISQLLKRGQRDYYDYLDRLFEPIKMEKIDADRAEAIRRDAEIARRSRR